jgi:lysophospholipase L1-like esterase
MLPGDELINLGKSNDTVISICRRVRGMRLQHPFDLAFLWVGVNDAACCESRLARLASQLRGQRRARDLDEFRDYYSKTLQLVNAAALKSVAVAPLLKGEDLSNPTNRQIAGLAQQIERATSDRSQTCYLDPRPAFERYLADKPISSYRTRGTLHVAWDVLRLQECDQVDAKSAKRGLWVTLDGVHLNSTGAEMVARAFVQCVEMHRSRQGQRRISSPCP